MRPDLSEIDAFSILIKTDWVHFDIPSDPILRYADKMRKLCNVCPLACHPHPMVEDDADSNSKHKLCTLTVIKAGFLKLDQTDYSDYERTEVAQLVKDLDKLLQVKPVEASPVEPASGPVRMSGLGHLEHPQAELGAGDIMERTEPNEHGVFVDRMSLPVLSNKKLKSILTIQVACGPDGRFYTGCDYRIGTSGHSGGPYYRPGSDQSFETFNEAVVSRINHLRKYVSGCSHIGGGINPSDIKKLQAAVDEFAKPYELALNDSAPVKADTITPLVTPAAPTVAPLPASKPFYVFGWMSAATISHGPQQLYVFRAGKEWGITYDLAEASPFKSVDAILTYYRKIGHVHGDPEARIYDGSLMIFQHGPAGLRQIPRLTRQGSLFDNPPPFVEEQIDLLQGDDAVGTYSPDELKILNTGFALVRYDRDNKTVQCTREDYLCGWAPPITFITYAAAEKTLKGMLTADNVVEVLLGGTVNMTTSSKKLRTAGFEFYRSEGIIPGHGSPRIKIGSKNWGTWCKYETGEECQSAWVELMKDPKALVG